MPPAFETKPVRPPAQRGRSSAGANHRRFALARKIRRDPDDVAMVAAQILAIAGRLRSRMRATTTAAGVEPDIVALLLLFSETTNSLHVGDIAKLLGVDKGTASRLAKRAETAGLIDKLPPAVDERQVGCRLSSAGDAALTTSLDWLRPHAIAVLHRHDREWAAAAQELLAQSKRLDAPTYESGWRAGTRLNAPCDD